MDAHGEVPAGRQATRRLQPRHDDAVARARQHRRTDDDDVTAVGRQGGADLLGTRSRYVVESDAVWRRRRADAHKGQVRRIDGVGHRRRRPQPPRLDGVGDEIADPLLEHGRAAVVDGVDLGWVDVDAEHVVTALGEARGRHDPDVAQAEDGDPHRRIVPIAARSDPAPRRRRGSSEASRPGARASHTFRPSAAALRTTPDQHVAPILAGPERGDGRHAGESTRRPAPTDSHPVRAVGEVEVVDDLQPRRAPVQLPQRGDGARSSGARRSTRSAPAPPAWRPRRGCRRRSPGRRRGRTARPPAGSRAGSSAPRRDGPRRRLAGARRRRPAGRRRSRAGSSSGGRSTRRGGPRPRRSPWRRRTARSSRRRAGWASPAARPGTARPSPGTRRRRRRAT